MRGAGELAEIRVASVQFVYVFLEVLDHRECALQARKLAAARKLFKQVERLNEQLLELEEIGPRLH